MLQSWLGGCWTAVGHGCFLPGEMGSKQWGKDQRATTQQVQCEPSFYFQLLNNVWAAALFMLRWKGELFVLFFIVFDNVLVV